jgi:hypothetical protein
MYFDFVFLITLRKYFNCTISYFIYDLNLTHLNPAQGIAAEILLVAEALEATKDFSVKPGPKGVPKTDHGSLTCAGTPPLIKINFKADQNYKIRKLLPDTKLGKYITQQVIVSYLPGNFSEGF